MRRRDPSSKRTAAREKHAERESALTIPAYVLGAFVSPWGCSHPDCLVGERLRERTGARTRTVPPPAHVLAVAMRLRELHPERAFPLRAAVARRLGCSVEAVRKALAAARRTR